LQSGTPDWSEAYLEGMKTGLPLFLGMIYLLSEAYLEGMKTTIKKGVFRLPKWGSEAYLEGMKT